MSPGTRRGRQLQDEVVPFESTNTVEMTFTASSSAKGSAVAAAIGGAAAAALLI